MMSRSLGKLGGSLVPAIVVAACALALLMYHGPAEDGIQIQGEGDAVPYLPVA